MEPNNQKTTNEPAFSNIPINSHSPQVISPTVSHTPLQSTTTGFGNTTAFAGQSNSGTSATTDPPPALPVVPVSKQPRGGRFSRFKNKKLILAGAGALAVLLCAGVVFGWYIPNKPENVYRTGLDRTGEAVEKLVMDSVSEDKLQIFENSNLSGKVDFKGKDSNFSAEFSSTYDLKASDSSVDAKFSTGQEAEKKIGLKLLTDMPENSYMPNIYFKLVGLNALGADGYYPGLSAYEDKWIAVTSEYLQSFLPKEEGSDPGNFTHADAKELATVATKKTREYLLTADTTKAVLVQKSFVGPEASEGLKTNRYKVGINKQNAKKYCKELSNDILSTKAYKRLSGSGDAAVKDQIKSAEESCDRSIDEVKDDTEFDMWIDKKTKLIHKVRFTDKDDKNSYTEIGQLYRGGDKLPFFVNLKSDKEKYSGRFDLGVDTKKNSTVGRFVMKQGGDYPYDLDIDFTFKPHGGEVEVNKPDGAISIQEVLNNLGFGGIAAPETGPEPTGSANGSTGLGNAAQDTERKTDINAMQSRLEEHYAVNGFYPSLSQFNSPTWRSTNMPDFDEAMLKDPAGSTTQLAAAPTLKQYSYSPAACNGSGVECQAYSLTAKLSDGTEYSKSSMF